MIWQQLPMEGAIMAMQGLGRQGSKCNVGSNAPRVLVVLAVAPTLPNKARAVIYTRVFILHMLWVAWILCAKHSSYLPHKYFGVCCVSNLMRPTASDTLSSTLLQLLLFVHSAAAFCIFCSCFLYIIAAVCCALLHARLAWWDWRY